MLLALKLGKLMSDYYLFHEIHVESFSIEH